MVYQRLTGYSISKFDTNNLHTVISGYRPEAEKKLVFFLDNTVWNLSEKSIFMVYFM